MEYENGSFGKWIYEERTKRGCGQAIFAKLLNVSRMTVSNWENGGSVPYSYIRYGVQYLLDNWDLLLKCHNFNSEKGKYTIRLTTGAWLKWRLTMENFPPDEFARMLGISTATIYRWMTPDYSIPLVTEYAALYFIEQWARKEDAKWAKNVEK